jgi:predicted RNase H-related nuclease YkuK (DUF458 family)
MEFFLFKNKQPINLIEYVKQYLETYPSTELLLTTDSQNHNNYISYATVLVLYRKNVGGHILYKKEKKARHIYGKESGKDFLKLYLESQMTEEVADYINNNLNKKVDRIELDYNIDEKFYSNKVLIQTMGIFKSKGYNVCGKPGLCIYAADRIAKQ